MYRCSECELLIGPADATEVDEPSRPCPACEKYTRPQSSADLARHEAEFYNGYEDDNGDW